MADVNRVAIIEKGGIPCLLKAMRKHPDDALLLEKVCATLRNLSAHGAPHTPLFVITCEDFLTKVATEVGRQRIREETGIEHVLDAMRSLLKSAPFQIQATAVLWNLALDCTTSLMIVRPAKVWRCADAGRTDANRIVIGRNGGIETLLRTLEAHPYNPELCHIAFGALSNIAINSAHHHHRPFA